MANAHIKRQEYNDLFLAELEKLNPAQAAAVDTIEGPVMVIAGPGTGKTHILAARIGRILTETDTLPGNILCLTFTDAGVIAMRERLLSFIGPEAHRVHIYTFHSFCNTIIQDNLELFGKQDLEPMSELDRVDLIRNLLDQLPPDHLLRRNSDPYFYEKHLQTLFQQMKSEDWSAALVNQQIDDYLEDLPNRPKFQYQRNHGQFQKGDLKTAQLEDEVQRMERLRAGAQLYPTYETAKTRARRYDYDDMILWVLRAFEEHEQLLRNYQEQYLYMLVDEYQDTNGAQNEIILQLTSYWEVPNIFIVGDDDQSIYEFQGARLKSLIDFYKKFETEIQLVVLKENYRSAQAILDQSAALINHNELRIINSLQQLGLNKNLQAANTSVADLPAIPRILEYPGRRHEVAGILQEIERLLETGVEADEIAVIYAQHRQVEELHNLLDKKGVPYSTRRKVNVLELPLIRKIRSMLIYFRQEMEHPFSGEHLLYQILHYDFLGIPPADLGTLSLHLAKLEYGQRPYWRELIRDQEQLVAVGIQEPAAFARCSEILERLLSESANYSLPVFLERLFNRSGLLPFVLAQEDKYWQVEVLNSFFRFVKEEVRRNPRLDLRGLLRVLDRMDDNRIALELNKAIEVSSGVNLLTGHSAKGLEFSYVFMIDCVADYWEPRTRRSSFSFKLPDTLSLSGEEDALEARRRLFYVAMTRAKRQLWLTYSRLNEKEKELRPAIFIDELLQQTALQPEQPVVAEEALLEASIYALSAGPSPAVSPQPRAIIDKLLADFRLSISGLNSYLFCPLGFYYEYILRVPSLMSEAAAYGTAMHNSMQRLFDNMLRSRPWQFPPLNTFLDFFRKEMQKQQMHFQPDAYNRRMEAGLRHLKQYYLQNLGAWHRKVIVEYNIRTAEFEGVPLKGTIDKLEFHDQQQVHIVDYKTGSHQSQKLRRPTEKKPEGGAYWRQLAFYKLLYENFDQTGRIAKKGTIAYLDPDPKGEFVYKTIDYSTEDMEAIRRLVQETWAKIKAHDFYTGCGKDNCKWCTFTRENKAYDSYSQTVIEETDD